MNAYCQDLVQNPGLSTKRGLGRQQRAGHLLDKCLLVESAHELLVEDLPDHTLPEVWHVLLCEVDWSVCSKMHIYKQTSTVTSIHLLWNFLALVDEFDY